MVGGVGGHRGQVRSEKACCCACLSFSYRIGTPY